MTITSERHHQFPPALNCGDKQSLAHNLRYSDHEKNKNIEIVYDLRKVVFDDKKVRYKNSNYFINNGSNAKFYVDSALKLNKTCITNLDSTSGITNLETWC
jgi:hypothetical protein